MVTQANMFRYPSLKSLFTGVMCVSQRSAVRLFFDCALTDDSRIFSSSMPNMVSYFLDEYRSILLTTMAGTIYATSIVLGGRLLNKETFSEESSSHTVEREVNKKQSASLSIGIKAFNIDGGYSNEQGWASSNTQKQDASQKNIDWSAYGGNAAFASEWVDFLTHQSQTDMIAAQINGRPLWTTTTIGKLFGYVHPLVQDRC